MHWTYSTSSAAVAGHLRLFIRRLRTTTTRIGIAPTALKRQFENTDALQLDAASSP